jgi:signal transduction histidine kinase
MASPRPTGHDPDADRGRGDVARFLRVVTHDLRQPLAATRTIVSVLAEGHAGPLLPSQADLVARLGRRLEFMQALVDDLIDLATAIAGPTDDAADLVTLLGPAIEAACGLAEASARAAGVAVRCDGFEGSLAVEADATDVAILLDNLVSNAVKYSPGGSVRVSAGRVSDAARVVVADTGIGIPDEARLHLFEEFYRAPNAVAIDPLGTGLGLAVVKAISDRCGFTIDVESAEGRGTTVTVLLPLRTGTSGPP